MFTPSGHQGFNQTLRHRDRVHQTTWLSAGAHYSFHTWNTCSGERVDITDGREWDWDGRFHSSGMGCLKRLSKMLSVKDSWRLFVPQHIKNICERHYVDVCGPQGENGERGQVREAIPLPASYFLLLLSCYSSSLVTPASCYSSSLVTPPYLLLLLLVIHPHLLLLLRVTPPHLLLLLTGYSSSLVGYSCFFFSLL